MALTLISASWCDPRPFGPCCLSETPPRILQKLCQGPSLHEMLQSILEVNTWGRGLNGTPMGCLAIGGPKGLGRLWWESRSRDVGGDLWRGSAQEGVP